MLTPQALRDKGFVYHAAGISGADQWQGMSHWINKERGIHLRGNVSTAKGGTLTLWDYPQIQIDNIEELDFLLKLVK